MSYQVLARKWRPRKFAEMVGQEHVLRALINALDTDTDMLREVMRMMIPQRLMPVLHTSTFKAWTEVPVADPDRDPDERALIDGYLAQANLLSVACEAVVRRAERERVPGVRSRVRDPDPVVVAMDILALALVTPKGVAGGDQQVPGPGCGNIGQPHRLFLLTESLSFRRGE